MVGGVVWNGAFRSLCQMCSAFNPICASLRGSVAPVGGSIRNLNLRPLELGFCQIYTLLFYTLNTGYLRSENKKIQNTLKSKTNIMLLVENFTPDFM
jgi:hypothetical protein